MKKCVNVLCCLLMVSVISFTMVSCDKKKYAMNELEDLVKTIDENGANYSDEEWEQVLEEYNKITDEMSEYDYSSKEAEHIGDLKIQFAKLVAKYRVSAILDDTKQFLFQIKGAVEGMMNWLKNFF
ncbi:MAG: hypothetical protein MJ010_07670 [Paludibacteraceae bacterium]|nr:hypothetical protein [Paludibacteraceae bacterium]